MNPINSTSIRLFADKVKTASRSKSKDIRLTIEDAVELSTVMLELLSKQNDLLLQIAEMSKNIQNNQGPISGGKL